MFVETVDTGVCGSYTTPYTEYYEVWKLYQQCIRDPCVVLIDMYSIDGMVEKPWLSAFQNFLWIKNLLNIKKVMGRNVQMCFVSTVST